VHTHDSKCSCSHPRRRIRTHTTLSNTNGRWRAGGRVDGAGLGWGRDDGILHSGIRRRSAGLGYRLPAGGPTMAACGGGVPAACSRLRWLVAATLEPSLPLHLSLHLHPPLALPLLLHSHSLSVQWSSQPREIPPARASPSLSLPIHHFLCRG
jgi:hypothetical protein